MKRILGVMLLQTSACGGVAGPAPRKPATEVAVAKPAAVPTTAKCAPDSAEDFVARGLAAKKGGRATEARSEFDCAIAALEARTGGSLQVDAPGSTESEIEDVAWSPKGALLAYASKNVVTVVDSKEYRPRFRLVSNADSIRSIAIDASETMLVTGSDAEVAVYDLSTGKRVATFDDRAPVAFVGTAKKIAAVHGDHVVVRPLENGGVEKTFARKGKKVDAFAWSADGDRLAMSTKNDPTIDLVEIASAKSRTVASDAPIHGLAIAGNGSIVAVGRSPQSFYDAVRVFDFESGKLLTTPQAKRMITDLSISYDGKKIAGSGTLSARVWTMPMGFSTRKLLGHDDTTTAVAMHPGGSLVASGGKDHGVFVWSLESKTLHEGTIQQSQSVASFVDGDEPTHAAAFSPDGKVLAISTGTSSVRIWDLANGSAPKRIAHEQTFDWTTWTYGNQRLELGLVRSLAFSADGERLAYGSDDGWLRMFDRTSETRSTFPEHGAVDLVGFFDGAVLAAGRSGSVRLHGLASPKLDRTLAGMRGVALSRDGKMLASRIDESLRIVDVANGKTVTTLASAPKSVSSIAFDSNAKTIAAASDRIRIWDTKSGELVRTFGGTKIALSALDFSVDGTTLATGDEQGHVRLFGVDGTEKWNASPLSAKITSVVFSPDGRVLVLTSVDGTTRLLSTSSGKTLLTFGTLAKSDGAFARAQDGTIELFGTARDHAVCRVGASVQPIELCEGRLVVEGLVAKTLAKI